MKKYVIPLVIAALFSSCKTSSLMIDVLKPAQINLPQEIQTVAIVNRSLPEKDSEVNNLVEGMLTGEALLADRFGSKSCLRGFVDNMLSSPRLKVVVPDVSLKGTGTDKMPAHLDWKEVDDICRNSGADALVSLETFDSNTEGRLFSLLNRTPGKNLTVKVQSGWRIYEPNGQRILDENIYTDYFDWDRPDEDGGIDKQEVVERAGYFAGSSYAARVSPSWMTVSRMYFKKGNDDFKEAKRLVRMGMFDEATRLWEKYTDQRDHKIAGYACYNMALASEMKGDLQTALDWATKAYREHRIKQAAQYMNVLNYRLIQEQQLNEQLQPEQ